MKILIAQQSSTGMPVGIYKKSIMLTGSALASDQYYVLCLSEQYLQFRGT